jgi:hypothetical protein
MRFPLQPPRHHEHGGTSNGCSTERMADATLERTRDRTGFVFAPVRWVARLGRVALARGAVRPYRRRDTSRTCSARPETADGARLGAEGGVRPRPPGAPLYAPLLLPMTRYGRPPPSPDCRNSPRLRRCRRARAWQEAAVTSHLPTNPPRGRKSDTSLPAYSIRPRDVPRRRWTFHGRRTRQWRRTSATCLISAQPRDWSMSAARWPRGPVHGTAPPHHRVHGWPPGARAWL